MSNGTMIEYHKIQSIWKRDERTKRFIEGAWTLPEFEYLHDKPWVFTEKVDGTNIRVGWTGERVNIGGRTESAQIYAPLIQRLQDLFPMEKMKASFDCPVTLFGEGYGARIQKGGGNYRTDGVDFVLFDVRIGEWWLTREAVDDVAVKLGIQSVPVIGRGTLPDAVKMCRDGFKSRWGDFDAEGVVAVPAVDLLSRNRQRIITKVKLRDFRAGGRNE